VIDAGGKSVIPGLIESHVQAVGVCRGKVVEPFLQLGSIPEIQVWTRKKATTAPAGEWVRFPRVDITRIKEPRMPSRSELDAAAPDRRVVFNAFPFTPGYTPDDIGATVYRALGASSGAEVRDALDRPLRLNAGTPIDALFEAA
jgi:hypothetical protein